MANSNDWQCIYCGAKPTQFVNGKPNPIGKCPVNANGHVWERLKDSYTNSCDW